MNEPVNHPNKYLSTVRSILDRHHSDLHGVTVFVVGSRASGRAKEFSDIDLLIDSAEPLTFLQMGLLKSDFEDSNLPISVDLLDAKSLAPEFYQLIKAD